MKRENYLFTSRSSSKYHTVKIVCEDGEVLYEVRDGNGRQMVYPTRDRQYCDSCVARWQGTPSDQVVK